MQQLFGNGLALSVTFGDTSPKGRGFFLCKPSPIRSILWYTIECEIMEWRTTSYAFTGH